MRVLTAKDFFHSHPARAPTLPGIEVRTMDLQPGLSVSLLMFNTEKNITVRTEKDDARYHFSCILRGRTQVSYENQQFELDDKAVLTTFMPGKRFQVGCSAGFCNIELRITRELLTQLAGVDADQLPANASPDHHCLLRNHNNLRISDSAHQVERLLVSDKSSPLLVHSAALEFLAWHLKSLYKASPDSQIGMRERKQLLAARERLLRDLSNPPTIEHLARETGLNQLKLKRGFKSMFGSSVYALFQRERMQQAQDLLVQYSVTETASMLGYSNLSHFSTAFRKQFGLLPSQSRKQQLGI